MSKEYVWNIRVGGTRHEICLKDRGNSFDVYVDEEYSRMTYLFTDIYNQQYWSEPAK